MKAPGYEAFKKGSFLFFGGGEQLLATCHSAVRAPSYTPLRMQVSPLNPGYGEEVEDEMPIWSDAGPGSTKDSYYSSPL